MYWKCKDEQTVIFYDYGDLGDYEHTYPIMPQPFRLACPNGLVWVGKGRGIVDGCDYPWKNPSFCNDKKLASE